MSQATGNLTRDAAVARGSHARKRGTEVPGERDEMLTVREICTELKVARQTLYEWWAKGRGPKRLRLPNGEIRVFRRDLEAFLAECLDMA